MRRPCIVVAAIAVLWTGTAHAQTAAPSSAVAHTASDDRLDWWRDARFGLFIHWGLYSIPAGEWGDRTDHAEWIRTTAQIPVETYDEFIHDFNPVKFDADAWCRLAKVAGMKYIVITTKHHDGFCLFDSAQTDFDVMSTPFKRDIMAELADACRRHGLEICWYHSIMDWHHPDYLPRRGWEKAARPEGDADMNRYVPHLHAQVDELLTKYGDIGVMWFDGEWEETWTRELGNALYDRCRALQPDVIVNNRVSKGRDGMAGLTQGEGFAGDFGTPEQEVPSTGLPGVDWESCITMNGHWGWNKADTAWKSERDLIRMLVDIASKGGNLLLNVGPRPDGTFPPEAVGRLEAIGRWMDVHADSIRGTTASPFSSLPWGRCTAEVGSDESILYLHVFDWPTDGALRVPGLANEIVSGAILSNGGAPLRAARDEDAVVVALPAAAPDPNCSVVALRIKGEPAVYEAPVIEAPADQFIEEMVVTLAASPGTQIRYTMDGSPPAADVGTQYTGPIAVRGSMHFQARAFKDGKAVSPIASHRFDKVSPWPALDAGDQPGLSVSAYKGDFSRLPDFAALEPAFQAVVEGVTLGNHGAGEFIGLVYEGRLRVDRDAMYTLALTSDDGSRLFIDGNRIIDNDGLHIAEMRTGSAPLAAGWHEIRLEWFNRTGAAALDMGVAPIGEAPGPVGGEDLSH